jgi:NADH:ubiquinone oxidoreductase subunit 6 (subunit J)
MIIAVIYSGAVAVIFLFLVIIVDSAQIESVSEFQARLPLVLSAAQLISSNLLWPLIEQFESAIKARRADLDCLFSDYSALYF